MSTPSLSATHLQHTLPNCNTLLHTQRDSCVFLLQDCCSGCRPHICLQHTCNTLYHVAIHYTTLKYVCFVFAGMLQRMSTPSLSAHKAMYMFVVVCCIVLQCVAVCCSVMQCVALRCSAVQWDGSCPHRHVVDPFTFRAKRNARVCCSVLQYVALCCSVW